ncbi:MAG: rhomboid family intramembrane serine protease, partial [Acidobacteriales bacterium]|nr:rhomboid family intramembrane serine protease [Terriglobales bacterium]
FETALDPDSRSQLIYQFGVVPANLSQGVELATVLPLFTSMFLHAGWLHLIANMWALWIFGDNIEDYLGGFRYLLLYLTCGVAGSLLHVTFNPTSPLPSVGASGAIAGVMGAYFLLFPSARVQTMVPFVFLFVWLPAWVVLGYWFLAEFVSGAASSINQMGRSSGGIAFWAHVGGFVAGVSLIKLFPSKRRYNYSFEE